MTSLSRQSYFSQNKRPQNMANYWTTRIRVPLFTFGIVLIFILFFSRFRARRRATGGSIRCTAGPTSACVT
jgi:hypothetical protein